MSNMETLQNIYDGWSLEETFHYQSTLLRVLAERIPEYVWNESLIDALRRYSGASTMEVK